jgi:hypothetical protein
MQDAPDPATTLTQDTSVDRDSSLRGRRQTLLRSGIALLLATGVLATTMLLLRGISNAENTPLPRGHFTEALLLCLPETETESAYTGVSECLRETLFVAEKLGNLQTAREDLGDLVAQRPWLHNYCHLAEHQVGAVIMGDPARVPALLLAHPGNTCSWGIGHGLLETFGSVRPADALWDEVIATCRALQTMPDPYPEVYALCADGIGHAAWDHHRELRGAVGRCEALLEASAVSSCTTGIMMQQYRPAETGEQPELDTAELEQYCLKRWPSTRPESLEGCASGIGYVLSLSLVGDTVSGALSANGTTEAVQLQAARKAVPALASGVMICSTLNALAETCHASLLTNLPAHLLTSERAWNDLCTGAGEALDSTCQNLRRPG